MLYIKFYSGLEQKRSRLAFLSTRATVMYFYSALYAFISITKYVHVRVRVTHADAHFSQGFSCSERLVKVTM